MTDVQTAVAALASSLWLLIAVQPASAENVAAPSAIGNQVPLWITVSPAYARTHMVAALAAPMSACTAPCSHLWVTRDGGGSWHGTAVPFDASHVTVLTDGSGGESILTTSSAGLERSDDDGATWTRLGAAGVAVAVGNGGVAVAVPAGHDYVVDSAGSHEVPGSNGADADLAFAIGDSAGGRPAALLAAADRATGADAVLQCDAALSCTGATPLPGGRSGDVAILRGGGGVAVARTTTALYRSADGGLSFVPLTLPAAANAAYTTVAGMALAPEHGDTVYVALLSVLHPMASGGPTMSGGVYASADGGTTWAVIGGGGPLDGGATSVAAAPDGRVFAGYVNAQGLAGLVCNDGGAEWRSACGQVASACRPQCNVARPAVSVAHPTTGSTPAPLTAVATTPSPASAALSSDPGLAATAVRTDSGSPYSVAAAIVVVALAVVAAPLSTLRRRRR